MHRKMPKKNSEPPDLDIFTRLVNADPFKVGLVRWKIKNSEFHNEIKEPSDWERLGGYYKEILMKGELNSYWRLQYIKSLKFHYTYSMYAKDNQYDDWRRAYKELWHTFFTQRCHHSYVT